MHIKKNLVHSFGGFTLDMDKIGNTSTSERAIKLPYTGRLPMPYTTASIFMSVAPEWVNIVLEVKTSKKRSTRYIVEADRDEIDSILWRFFFETTGSKSATRFDNGLSKYWNGSYQAEFLVWHSIGKSPTKVARIIQQLPHEQRASLYRMIDLMRQEEAVAE